MKLIELEDKEFIEFSKNYPYSLFFQSPYWIEVKKTNGWSGKIVGLKENDKIVAASVILFKKIKFITIAYAPRGFLLDYNDNNLLETFTKEVKEYLKNKKVTFLKINPYIDYQKRDVNGNPIEETKNNILMERFKKLGYKHHGFYITAKEKEDIEPRWLSVLNIENDDIDTLFKNMRSTTRWSIRNSEKNSLRIIECDRANLKEFKDLMQHTADRRKFNDRPLSYYENIYDVLHKENLVKILLVEINFSKLLDDTKKDYDKLLSRIDNIKDNPKKQGQLKELENEKESFKKRINDLENYTNEYGHSKIIAGGLYMLYGKQLVYLLGASYKEFMKYNSQYLLQWEMIKYAKENNYQTFNFYGIDGDFSKESENYGLFDFKRGFNATVVELIGEFDLIINKPIYHLYNIAYNLYHKLKNLKNK